MYFGVWFSTRLSFSHSSESQTAKIKAVLHEQVTNKSSLVEILKTL